MKVYYGNINGKQNILLACNSITEFARILKVPYGYAKQYVSEAVNNNDIAIALKNPKIAFVKDAYNNNAKWAKK